MTRPIPGSPADAPIPPFPGSTQTAEQPTTTEKATGYHFVGEYWDIAVTPIRPDTLAVSLWRLSGYRNKRAMPDMKYISEVRRIVLLDFIRDSLLPEADAEIRCGDLCLQVVQQRAKPKELFVGHYGGRKHPQGHNGPIEDSILMAIRAVI